jgi:hypothetical protein
MSSTLSILVLAGDPGGGAALVPVLQQLILEQKTNVHIYAYRQSANLFRRQKIPFVGLTETTTLDDCRSLLERHRPSVILTATSVNGIDLEKKLIAAAKDADIPSLAVLDFWTNYRARFEDEHRQLTFLPDRIAVMDQRAVTEMCKLGFPVNQLIITGQPALDRFIRVPQKERLAIRARLRKQLKLNSQDHLIVFISQHIEDAYRDLIGTEDHPGYTEKSVFESLLDQISALKIELAGNSFTILIKPHPCEREDSWSDVLAQSDMVRVDRLNSTHDLAVTADQVVGMFSMALIECALLGCPVVSFQPDRISPPKEVIKDHTGIDTVTKQSELLALLKENILKPQTHLTPEKTPTIKTATSIVTHELLCLSKAEIDGA